MNPKACQDSRSRTHPVFILAGIEEISCCKGTMKPVRKVIHREEIEFFLRLHGLWEGIVMLPCPPPPPFDIHTMEPIEPPWQAIKESIPDD
jgi:hypothetical protein